MQLICKWCAKNKTGGLQNMQMTCNSCANRMRRKLVSIICISYANNMHSNYEINLHTISICNAYQMHKKTILWNMQFIRIYWRNRFAHETHMKRTLNAHQLHIQKNAHQLHIGCISFAYDKHMICMYILPVLSTICKSVAPPNHGISNKCIKV